MNSGARIPSDFMGVEIFGITRIDGPLLFVEGIRDVGYDELVEIRTTAGERRLGKVLECTSETAVIEVFQGTTDLTLESTGVTFTGSPLTIPVSRDLLGRIVDSTARPLDDGPSPLGEARDINGWAMNPISREYPREFIQTGISSIDVLMTLIRGQKLPIFSCSGLPHERLAAQITRQASVKTDEEFVVVFAAMGITHDSALFFRENFEKTGVLEKVAMFVNYADDPSIERLITPRAALTLAEHLAFDEGMHVLVILTDMTSYCEALREVASARGEIPSRKGYPGYLYSDLASIYERAGRMKNRKGSITQIPILTMPNDDITHPVPDLTGFITEGQIVLDREIHYSNVYPPINIFPSLSRLMKDGIGEGSTREDHQEIANQLYSFYARVQHTRQMATIIGEDELNELDKRYLAFGEEFEKRFLTQHEEESRTIEESLDLAWELASMLPREEFTRVSRETLEKRYVER